MTFYGACDSGACDNGACDIANQGMTVQFKSAAVELEKSLAERHALREAGDNTYRQHGHVGKMI